MRLREFLNKSVVINDAEKDQWCGKVVSFTPAFDSDTGEDQIVLLTEDGLIGFAESEIVTITEML